MPTTIEFNHIVANNLVDNALLFNGGNQVFGWSSHLKQNKSLVAGGKFNLYTGDFNILTDNNILDFVVYDPDVTIGTGLGAF